MLGVLHPGEHGSTFGGNPLAAAVGLEVVRMLMGDDDKVDFWETLYINMSWRVDGKSYEPRISYSGSKHRIHKDLRVLVCDQPTLVTQECELQLCVSI